MLYFTAVQVNHIKIPSDFEPLAFAQRLLQQASSTITLSIKRQVPSTPAFPSGLHCLSPVQSLTSVLSPMMPDVESSIYANVRGAKNSLGGIVPVLRSPNLKSLLPHVSAIVSF